jgi:hypothetical protein
MKKKNLPKPPLTNLELPPLEPEKRHSYSSSDLDELDLRVIDYGSYCLMHPESEKGSEELWKYLDVEDIRAGLELKARELIKKQNRPNNFTATIYTVGTIDTEFWAVIGLRFSIYADGSERKVWRAFMAAEEGLEEIMRVMSEDIEATAERMNDLTEKLGGGTN